MRPTRHGAVGTALALTAAATWSLAQAGGAAASGDGLKRPAVATEHLSLFARDTSQTPIDLAPKGTSEGDLLVFHGLKYDKKGGKVVGRYGGTCTTLTKGKGIPEDWICAIDIVLPGGHLFAEGIGKTADIAAGKKFVFGVTGGTGKYRAARGEGSFTADVGHPMDAYEVIDIIL